MHNLENIRLIKDIYIGRSADLPESPGVYAFWWLGSKEELLASNRHVVLKGPGGKSVDVRYNDWWPKELIYPCLYVGKTTNIKNRFALHIKNGSGGRLHASCPSNEKAKPITTSCQLRFGIEHIFPHSQEPLKIILNSVGFSYNTTFKVNAVAERFFEEDRLVGTWRPWFNIDSER